VKDSKAARRPSADVLADLKTKFIVENMTARHTRTLNDLFSGKLHPLPCTCWLCLWRKYEKKRPPGHPYDYLTFLASDILSEVMDEFQYEPVKRIPIKRLAREVIGRLPNIGDETKTILNKTQRKLFEARFLKYNRQGRYRTNKLSDLVEALSLQIHRDWMRTRPQPVAVFNLNRQTSGALAQKIADFVYSQPGHKATQRQLQRFTNKRKADLEGLHEWLEWRHGIKVPPHEKWESTIYVGTQPVSPKSRVRIHRAPLKSWDNSDPKIKPSAKMKWNSK
jgi:hypothetical protein